MPTLSPLAFDAALCARARERAFAIGDDLALRPNAAARGISDSSGDALLHAALALASGETKYEAAMHAALRRAAEHDGRSIGLFSGASGLRAAAELATSIEPRYRSLVERIDAFVESELPSRPVKPPTYLTYDVIEGWAGARLARAIRGPREPDRLSSLLAWLIADAGRWTCPHPSGEDPAPVRDLGVAHGIAGVLATIVLTHDTLDSHLAEAVHGAANHLASCAYESDGLPVWPRSLGSEPEERPQSAWCYGTPGVTAALYACARALEDQHLAALALEAALGCARRDPRDWLVSQMGICHGLMGNALCFASIAAASANTELRVAAERLAIETLDRLDADGGRCFSANHRGRYAATNEIVGTAGIALALLTLIGAAPSDWMRVHALSPL